MTKLTPAQAAALTYVGFAKGQFPVAPANHATVTWNSLEKKGLVSVNRGPNGRDIMGVGLTVAGRAALSASEDVAPVEWPTADGSVVALADLSDQQVEALTDIATVQWTPAHRKTVESLLRFGLITWVPDTTDPAEFRLTAEGNRAYAAVAEYKVVPNRADRRRHARSLKTIRPSSPHRTATPTTKAVRALKLGERFSDRLGRTVAVLGRPEHQGTGLSIMVRTESGEEVRAMFPTRKDRVVLTPDSPVVKMRKRASLRVGDMVFDPFVPFTWGVRIAGLTGSWATMEVEGSHTFDLHLSPGVTVPVVI